MSQLEHLIKDQQLAAETLTKLAWIFDGTPKAIRRNSGGLIAAEPTEVVFPENNSPSTSEIRVKMVFFDLERNKHQQIISKKIITASKLVPLKDIEVGFVNSPGLGGFVVDFGFGLIPVHFISSYRDNKGFEWALAARQDEYEKAKLSTKPEAITLFEIPKKMLCWIEPLSPHGKKDFQWAKSHLAQLSERKKTIIPRLLIVAESCKVSPNLSVKEMDDHLKEVPRHQPIQWDIHLEPMNEN